MAKRVLLSFLAIASVLACAHDPSDDRGPARDVRGEQSSLFAIIGEWFSGPPEMEANSEFAGAPKWVLQGCSAYWGDDGGSRICGVGDAKIGRSMSIARTKATSRARAEISRTLETKVKSMIKDFQEQVAGVQSGVTDADYSSATVSLNKASLGGTVVQDTWVSANGQLFVLVALDADTFGESLRGMDTEMSDRLRTFIEQRARKSFLEEDEVEDD